MTTSLFDELQWRGLVYDSTEGARDLLAGDKVTAYVGFDPTASSLHVGTLLPMLALVRLQKFGHSPIAVVGGGTGLIGDPSGKTAERTLLTAEQVEANVAGIRAQLERFIDFDSKSNPARLVNNAEWLTKLNAMEFLRDVGKYFTVNYLLAKETVKRRVEGEEGISYTEFSYLLLQAYDFLVLHDRFKCVLQMGGSDQWGNIVAGCELIRKRRAATAHGLVMPLLTTSRGTKFGKTEAGTVWLDPSLTSPFRFYQFWLNTDDRDVVRYLKFFTSLDRASIEALEHAVAQTPEKREAQRTLAREVTTMVHGEAELSKAEMHTAALFGLREAGGLPPLSGDDSPAITALKEIGEDLISSVTLEAQLFPNGISAVDLAMRAGLVTSKSEATRLIQQGGLYLDDERLSNPRATIGPEFLTPGRIFKLRKGQRERRLVRIGG